MKMYESVVIGNFLYILGLYDGLRAEDAGHTPRVVNLLQQTPLDKTLADVLIQSPGSLFIIEFKRKGASEKKEIAEKENLRDSLRMLPVLEQLSKEIHWYVRSSTDASDLQLEVFPYLSDESHIQLQTLDGLARRIIQRRGAPHDIENCRDYLRNLRIAARVTEGRESVEQLLRARF